MIWFMRRSSAQGYPECVEEGVVLRHNGAHAIFVDLTKYATRGCWQDDCKLTDKFIAVDKGICARACQDVLECMHWAYGEQGGAPKCFLRKSDGGREALDGWAAGPKACAPPPISDALAAWRAADLPEMLACDNGVGDACPDMARAMGTWRFAIASMLRASEGVVDTSTRQYMNQISEDTKEFITHMSEESFPVIVGNNRQVFNALRGWLRGQPTDHDPEDMSLPLPLRGKLCGPESCYE